jgi:starch synthase (maltosyl-transferring)
MRTFDTSLERTSSLERTPASRLPQSAEATALAATQAPRLVVETVSPSVDDGRYPVKRIVGDWVNVEVDAYGEGHDRIAVELRWRAIDENEWHEARMRPLGNDRWAGEFQLQRVGRYVFTVEAWRDEFAIFRYGLGKKVEAGLVVSLEIEEGRQLVHRILRQLGGAAAQRLQVFAAKLDAADETGRLDLLLAEETIGLMADADPRPYACRLERERVIEAERPAAGTGAWYALFARSQSGDVTRHGTFDDVINRLPAIRAMGFDVVYLMPIHPIGHKNRKGRNNSLVADIDDPGSPYAIGSEAGGHTAIHPELGTFEDFHRLVAATKQAGMEIAIDIAIQASPDHPWLKLHPDWFDWRPDGSIRYAENPPKKYEDIVNVDFYADGAKPSLWLELRDLFLFWVGHGVKVFRVDNPHTKPFPFWEWVIAEVRSRDPEVIFLSEAFTRPKIMYRLAKVGFSQSYTYFTWRDTKRDLQDYFTELSQDAPKEFFRPHLFVNTHDINPDFLQHAPRPAFLIRAALAATLSGLWGIYNGFELCEGRPDAKKKEYANSEKYQLVAWDWDRPGNIVADITLLNRIRRENPALQSHLGVTFLSNANDRMLVYEKATPSRDNVLVVAISLDTLDDQQTDIATPLNRFGLTADDELTAENLISGRRETWTGPTLPIRLTADRPFDIWRVNRPNQ